MDIDNYKFKLACNRFGLDYNKALYCTNVVVVPGGKENIYVSFDKRCNVVDIRKYTNINGSVENYFESLYSIFNDEYLSNISICSDDNLISTKISLGKIIKITDKYRYDSKYSRVSITDEDNLDENQKSFVSYLSFLRSIGDKYNMIRYQMISCGVDIPDQRSYIRYVINDLNNYVDECLKTNICPNANDFINYSGQISVFLTYSGDINDAINLLLRIRGYEISNNGIINPTSCINVDELIRSFDDKLKSNSEIDYSVQKKKIKKED